MQGGFKAEQVTVEGRYSDYSRISDEADRKEHVFHFCPDCGSQVFYTEPTEPELIVVSVGAFADPTFPPPTESGYDSTRHPWIGLPESVVRHAPEVWATVQPLYEACDYAEAADRGRELLAAIPTTAGCSTAWRAPKASRADGRGARAPRRRSRAVGRHRAVATETRIDPIRDGPPSAG
jgi:hypothetical protein